MTESLDKTQQHNSELNMQIHERAAKISDMQKFFNQQFMLIGVTRFPNHLETLASELGSQKVGTITAEAKNFNQTVATEQDKNK